MINAEVRTHAELMFGLFSGLFFAMIEEEAKENGREVANMQDFAVTTAKFVDRLKEINDQVLAEVFGERGKDARLASGNEGKTGL